MNKLPTIRLSQHAVETAYRHADKLRVLARVESPTLTTDCRQAGLPMDLAAICGGLLASVIDDLIVIGRLPRSDFERTKRKERVLKTAEEPALSALRIAMAASPLNGRAAVSHWENICDRHERGKFAWLLGVDSELAYEYGRRVDRRSRNEPGR